MPLPPILHSKYLAHLDALIDEGTAILRSAETRVQPGAAFMSDSDEVIEPEQRELVIDQSRFHEWSAKVATALCQLVPAGHVHRQFAEDCAEYGPYENWLVEMVAKLRAVKDDYEAGFLDDLPTLVRAEIASDYMAQAEELHGKGYHVPAAVLAGAVLEDALRKLCTREGISLESDKGRRKTIEPMNTDLNKKNVYNAAKTHEIRGWTALRNDAAHGEGGKVECEAVGRMIEGVRSFVADYLR